MTNPCVDPSVGEVSSLSAKDWMYIAEGGEHAIFEYNPTKDDSQATKLVGKILRIKKKDLRACSSIDENLDKILPTESDVSTTGINSRHVDFQMPLLYSTLELYIDEPKPIELSFEFVHELFVNTIGRDTEEAIIPTSRRKDWTYENIKKIDYDRSRNHISTSTRTIQRSIEASIQPNYRRLNNDALFLSVEIKPKAGYIPYSPLIHPKNRAKFFHSRFEILQQLYKQNIIDKAWSLPSGDRVISNYNPLDLFSGDCSRMKNAIKCLFDCPQNNLKVYCNNTILYGTSTTNSTNSGVKRNVLESFFHENQGEDKFIHQCLQTKLQDLVCTILHQHYEDFLQKLLALQKMHDILDYDGVGIVYEKLVDLCNGSKDEADKMVDTMNYREARERNDCHALNETLGDLHSIFCHKSGAMISYLAICQEILEWSSQHHQGVITEKMSMKMDQWYEDGLNCVKTFNKDDCISLLQIWLLSLMMNDISFIITISSLSDKNARDSHLTKNQICINDQYFSVNIKVLDFDGKPVSKLRNRSKIESKISKFHSLKLGTSEGNEINIQ